MIWRYELTSFKIWSNFDTGYVVAPTFDTAFKKAKEQLQYDLDKVNSVLQSADVTNHIVIEMDLNSIELKQERCDLIDKTITLKDCVHSQCNGKRTKVLFQEFNESKEIILCVDLEHPEDPNTLLWVNISQVDSVIIRKWICKYETNAKIFAYEKKKLEKYLEDAF